MGAWCAAAIYVLEKLGGVTTLPKLLCDQHLGCKKPFWLQELIPASFSQPDGKQRGANLLLAAQKEAVQNERLAAARLKLVAEHAADGPWSTQDVMHASRSHLLRSLPHESHASFEASWLLRLTFNKKRTCTGH